MHVSKTSGSSWELDINTRVFHFPVKVFLGFGKGVFDTALDQSSVRFVQKLIFEEVVLQILREYFSDKLGD